MIELQQATKENVVSTMQATLANLGNGKASLSVDTKHSDATGEHHFIHRFDIDFGSTFEYCREYLAGRGYYVDIAWEMRDEDLWTLNVKERKHVLEDTSSGDQTFYCVACGEEFLNKRYAELETCKA